MNIKSVTLTNGGFKGLVAEYTLPSERIGKSKFKLLKESLPHPIHPDLETPFKDLRFHLLEIFEIINSDMDKNDIDSQLSQCEVTGISFDSDHFIIKGIKGYFTNKSAAFPSLKVEKGDNYESYDTVRKIIEKIVDETKKYLNGDVKLDENEIVERWIGSGRQKGVDTDLFNQMEEEERKEFCRNILEKDFGAVVLMEEDITIGDHADEETAFVIDPKEEVITLPAKK